MKKLIVVTVVCAMFLVSIQVTKASTINDIMAKVVSLQKQVAELQSQLTGLVLSAVKVSAPTKTIVPTILPTIVKQIVPAVTLPTINNKIISNPIPAYSNMQICIPQLTYPWIRVLGPNGGETYTAGQQMTVTWSKCNIANTEAVNISLEYNSTSTVLINHTPNDGTETITLPNTLPNYGTIFKVKVIRDGALLTHGIPLVSDLSDNLFTINGTWVNVGTNYPSVSQVANDITFAMDSNNIPYVAYGVSTMYGASVMKFNGTSWVNVGAVDSIGVTYYLSIALDSNNIPYIAYMDTSGQFFVKKFNGTSWIIVGNAGFATGLNPGHLSIVLDSNNVPYVSFMSVQNIDNAYKISVMKFNGTSWVYVGIPEFSNWASYDSFLALDSNNVPYVAYYDYQNSGQASVMKFNGTSWVNVGNPGISTAQGFYSSLAFDSNNVPYLIYSDVANGMKTTVMKFNGTSWVNVGTPGFSLGQANFTSIALNSNNVPYVAFRDNINSYKVSVMKFNGTSWVNVGEPAFSVGDSAYSFIIIDSNNIPYVAYKDQGISYGLAVVKKYLGN